MRGGEVLHGEDLLVGQILSQAPLSQISTDHTPEAGVTKMKVSVNIGLNPFMTVRWGEGALMLRGPARWGDGAGLFKLGRHTDFPRGMPGKWSASQILSVR